MGLVPSQSGRSLGTEGVGDPVRVTRGLFNKWVHDALSSLYDTPYLQSHPLTGLLTQGEEATLLRRSQNLRRVLLETIESMRPEAGAPARSPDWRAYRILELRFIEGLSPRQAMKRLALGRSQYFREQARVLELLTEDLWERWQAVHNQDAAVSQTASTLEEQSARSETERLSAHAIWEDVGLSPLLDSLRTVVEALADAQGVDLEFSPLQHLTVLRADRVMLRQAILLALTHALRAIQGGHLEIRDFAEPGVVGIVLSAGASRATKAQTRNAPDPAADLDVCRQLMEAMGGTLRIRPGPTTGWETRLAWKVKAESTLLVVDDNQGLIDLFQRYLTRSGWRVLGARSGEQARRAVAETRPTAIALDVMMPEEDGWELLQALKSDARTRGIPVIICSALKEAQLASSLGAAAYLSKPVSQQALLETLAAWERPGASPATEPRASPEDREPPLPDENQSAD